MPNELSLKFACIKAGEIILLILQRKDEFFNPLVIKAKVLEIQRITKFYQLSSLNLWFMLFLVQIDKKLGYTMTSTDTFPLS